MGSANTSKGSFDSVCADQHSGCTTSHSPAIGFSTFNLRPFYPPVATPAITIRLIYLIIISFFSYSFYLPIHMTFTKSPGHRPLKFYQLIIWRWIATVIAYCTFTFRFPYLNFATNEIDVSLPLPSLLANLTRLPNPLLLILRPRHRCRESHHCVRPRYIRRILDGQLHRDGR